MTDDIMTADEAVAIARRALGAARATLAAHASLMGRLYAAEAKAAAWERAAHGGGTDDCAHAAEQRLAEVADELSAERLALVASFEGIDAAQH